MSCQQIFIVIVKNNIRTGLRIHKVRNGPGDLDTSARQIIIATMRALIGSVPLSFARRRSHFACVAACVPSMITYTMSDRTRNELAVRLRAVRARVWSLWKADHVACTTHHTEKEWRIRGLRSLSLSPALSFSLLILSSTRRSTCCNRQWRALSASVTSPELINRSDVMFLLLPYFLSLLCIFLFVWIC